MSYNHRILSNHIAREAQLLAEEKWIIDALNKIKAQRNSLQIERLNLESKKAQFKNEKKPIDSQNIENSNEEKVSALSLMQAVASAAISQSWAKEDAHCNEEELNLTVTNPILSTQVLDNMSAEEEEDDDEDEVMLDINMLMDAAHKAD